MSRDGYALGVDLGTSNTVAVIRWPDGRSRPLLVDGQPVLPSGAYLDEHGRLHVGRDAQRMAQLDPARFEPNPKRHIDEPTVLLGDRELATVDLLAAVLAQVGRVAVEAVGFLPPTALTHPASWGPRRRELLAAAATRAGWPAPYLLAEPVAAARYFVDVLRRPVGLGSSLAVFDFGGGTFDVAVVRNEGSRFAVLGSGGLEDLGGLDIDAALVDHLGRMIATHRPDVWAGLAHGRARRLFWEDVRAAKEMLSRATVAPVAVPGLDHAVHLTRAELEHVAEPLLRRAVNETAATIARCGLRPDELAGLFLVGGSSRLPLVARMLHGSLHIAPTVLEQPELPVAEGAVAALAPPAPPNANPAAAGGPAPGGAAPLPDLAVTPARPRSRRRLLLATAVAAVLAVAVAAVSYAFWPDGAARVTPGAEERPQPVAFTDNLGEALTIPLGGTAGKVFSQTVGDRAYAAWQLGTKLKVAAIDLPTRRKLWEVDAPGDAADYLALVASERGGVVVVPQATDTRAARPIYVLDPVTGAVKWQRVGGPDDRYAVYESVLVIVSNVPGDRKIRALKWEDGTTKWEFATPDGVESTTYVVDEPDAFTTPGQYNGTPYQRSEKNARVIQIDDKRTLRVIDVASGTRREKTNVAYKTDAMKAVGNRLYVVSRADALQIREYDLTTLAEPDIVYTNTGTDRQVVAGPYPCGVSRNICFLERQGVTDEKTDLVAASLAERKEVWRQPQRNADFLMPVGTAVLATTESSTTPESGLFDVNGKQVLPDEARTYVAVRINGASVLLFSVIQSQFNREGYPTKILGATVTGEPKRLGEVKDLRSQGCSWNTRYLTCPTATAFKVWRFAG
jgi:molecular chaperone HscA